MMWEQSIFDAPEETPKLSKYQTFGARWLAAKRRAILADDIGLGKTATAIAASDLVKSKHTLVIAPLSLLTQWRDEIIRFSTHSETQWKLVNYEKVARCTEDYDCIIVDEASYIKSAGAQRSENVVNLGMRTPYVFFLTATPVRNEPSDLINMLLVCTSGMRKDPMKHPLKAVWNNWDRKYFYITPHGRKLLMPMMREEWNGLVKQYMLRRTKQMLNLPSLSTQLVAVPWSAQQEAIYRQAETGLLQMADGELQQAENALAIAMRLRQAAIDPALFGGPSDSGKAKWVTEFLLGEGQQHRVLIFSEFALYCMQLAETLKRWKPAILIGSMNQAQRSNELARWKDGQTDVFILSSQAGGFGLNLQEADVVIHTDLPWTMDVMEQRVGRAYRRGQNRPVHEYILGHKDCIDRAMYKVIKRKGKVASETVAIATVLEEIRKERRG